MRFASLACVLAVALSACAAQPVSTAERDVLRQQVADTERAFARTMADRNLAGFTSFLSQETVFFSGPTPLRGPDAVTAFWKRFYEKPQAPFSWEPKEVEVLDSGKLAMSSGPVYDPSGKLSGTFTSVWRQEAPGVWKIVFDKGCDVCEACPGKP